MGSDVESSVLTWWVRNSADVRREVQVVQHEAATGGGGALGVEAIFFFWLGVVLGLWVVR